MDQEPSELARRPEIAGMLRRFVAIIIDLMIVNLLVLMIAYVFHLSGLRIVHTRVEGGLFSLLVAVIYFSLYDSELRSGSFGKQLLEMSVVDEIGNRLTLRKSILRSLIKMVTGLVPVIWLVAIFTQYRQGFHDIASETYVVRN